MKHLRAARKAAKRWGLTHAHQSLVGSTIATMQSDREYITPLAGVVVNEKTRAIAESETLHNEPAIWIKRYEKIVVLQMSPKPVYKNQ